jgi:hypothetical protein
MDQKTTSLKESLSALVRENGIAAVVEMLSHVCRQEGHAAKFEKEDHPLSALWYKAGEDLSGLSGQLPTKEVL